MYGRGVRVSCGCRSDPILQSKDKLSSSEGVETRHGVTSSEPLTQIPAASVPEYRMIDVPPSDYLAKPRAVDKV